MKLIRYNALSRPYYPYACIFIDAGQILLEQLEVSETDEIMIKEGIMTSSFIYLNFKKM